MNRKVPGRIIAFLAIGLLALSQSGNIIRMAQANPVAITAWRLIIATVLLLPLSIRKCNTMKSLSGSDIGLLFLAQGAMALHFFSWIFAIQTTTIANAALCFSINPVMTAALAWLFLNERASRRLMISIACGVIGVGVIGGVGLELHPETLLGNASAVLSAFLFSTYLVVARRIRQKLDADLYVTLLYGGAGLISLIVLLSIESTIRLNYSGITWLGFVMMALIPTLIGHTSLNAASRYMDSGRISAWTLVEPLLAGIVAFFVWSEPVGIESAFGYLFICASVILLVTDRSNLGKIK